MVVGRAKYRSRAFPGLGIIFVAMLLVLATHAAMSSAAAAAPKATGLTVSPDPYNPEGKKRLKISFQLSESARVKVKVIKTRVVMRKSRTVGAGKVKFSWDGRQRSGNRVKAGTYKLVVRVRNRNGRSKKSMSFKVSKENPRAPLDPGSVLAEHIANAVITSLHIKNGSIQATDIAEGVVSALALTVGAVKGEHLADGAVLAAKVANGAITSAKLADGGNGAKGRVDYDIYTMPNDDWCV